MWMESLAGRALFLGFNERTSLGVRWLYDYMAKVMLSQPATRALRWESSHAILGQPSGYQTTEPTQSFLVMLQSLLFFVWYRLVDLR
jgi:hypothetical protein